MPFHDTPSDGYYCPDCGHKLYTDFPFGKGAMFGCYNCKCYFHLPEYVDLFVLEHVYNHDATTPAYFLCFGYSHEDLIAGCYIRCQLIQGMHGQYLGLRITEKGRALMEETIREWVRLGKYGDHPSSEVVQ